MSSLDAARRDLADVAAKMLKITEDRSLSDQVKLARLDQFQPALSAAEDRVKDLEYIADQRRRIFRGTAPGDSPTSPLSQTRTPTGIAPPLTLPEPVLRELHAAAAQRRSLRLDLDTPTLSRKAGNDPEDWSESYVPSVLMPTVTGLSEPTRVAALYPAMNMPGPSVEYVRITGHDGAAAVTAPGALKPDVGLLSEKLVAPAVKIAGVCTVEDESLEDFPDFARVVTAELQRSVIDAENAELLTGNGNSDPAAGALHMLGLLNVPGILTRTAAAGETMADTLEQAITDLRVGPSFAEADAVILNPTDWSSIRRLKDSAGRYIVDVDPTAAAPLTLWGVTVKITTTMPAGTAVVGRFSLGGVLHVRRGLQVEVSNQHADNWQRNRSSFRAELREVAVITRPTAFCKVDLTAGT